MNQPVQSNVIRPGLNLRFTIRSIVTMRRRLSRGFCLVSVERKDQQLRVVTWWRWELVLKHGGIKQGSLESVPRDPHRTWEWFHGTKNNYYALRRWLDIPCSSSENMTIDAKGVLHSEGYHKISMHKHYNHQPCNPWLVNVPRKNNVPPLELRPFF